MVPPLDLQMQQRQSYLNFIITDFGAVSSHEPQARGLPQYLAQAGQWETHIARHVQVSHVTGAELSCCPTRPFLPCWRHFLKGRKSGISCSGQNQETKLCLAQVFSTLAESIPPALAIERSLVLSLRGACWICQATSPFHLTRTKADL